MHDPRRSALGCGLDQMIDVYRAKVRSAGNDVTGIARHDHDLAAPDLDWLPVSHRQQAAARRHVVVGDDLPGRGRERSTVLRGDLSQHAPRGAELRIEEDPSRKAHRPQHVQQSIQRAVPPAQGGGSVKSSGASRITRRAAAGYVAVSHRPRSADCRHAGDSLSLTGMESRVMTAYAQGNPLSGATPELANLFDQAVAAFNIYRGDPVGLLDQAIA